MKLSSLYIESHTRIGKFPKRSQYTIGKRIEDILLNTLSLVILARAKSERSQLLLLEKIDVHLREIMILLRMCEKTKNLDITGYVVLSEKLIEIGKILGGWIKNCKTKTSL
jgi:hypothetical protein